MSPSPLVYAYYVPRWKVERIPLFFQPLCFNWYRCLIPLSPPLANESGFPFWKNFSIFFFSLFPPLWGAGWTVFFDIFDLTGTSGFSRVKRNPFSFSGQSPYERRGTNIFFGGVGFFFRPKFPLFLYPPRHGRDWLFLPTARQIFFFLSPPTA